MPLKYSISFINLETTIDDTLIFNENDRSETEKKAQRSHFHIFEAR